MNLETWPTGGSGLRVGGGLGGSPQEAGATRVSNMQPFVSLKGGQDEDIIALVGV